jgi:hypothetical protein
VRRGLGTRDVDPTPGMTCGGSGAPDEGAPGVTRPCCLEAEAYHRIPDRDRVPRLTAPALDAAAVEFGGNGAERLTGELLQDRPQHLVALSRRRHQLQIAKLLALRTYPSPAYEPSTCRVRARSLVRSGSLVGKNLQAFESDNIFPIEIALIAPVYYIGGGLRQLSRQPLQHLRQHMRIASVRSPLWCGHDEASRRTPSG